jgi:hypothetical protein
MENPQAEVKKKSGDYRSDSAVKTHAPQTSSHPEAARLFLEVPICRRKP